MPWLSHPYRRFILLGALLFAGMTWLGYRAGGEQSISGEVSGETGYCPATDFCTNLLETTTDTVAVVHHFDRAKVVRPLPRTVDRVAVPGLKLPTVVLGIPPPPIPPAPPPPGPKIVCIFKISERMPVFPGCDERVPYEERKARGEQKLLEFIYANVRYPAHAREQNCAGTAVIEFVVGKQGRVEEPRIISDPGCGLGAVALAAVGAMNEQGIVWEPGRQGGRNVRVKYYLPVRFKLE